MRKASQVKESRESQVAARNFIERDHVDDEQRTRSDLPACPFLLFLSLSLSPSCLPHLHCMLVLLKGFWGHDCAACSLLLLLLVVFLSLKINLSWHLHAALRGERGSRERGQHSQVLVVVEMPPKKKMK